RPSCAYGRAGVGRDPRHSHQLTRFRRWAGCNRGRLTIEPSKGATDATGRAYPAAAGRPIVRLTAPRTTSPGRGPQRPEGEESWAAEAGRLGYGGIAGSDAHIVSRIGRCGTEFSDPIGSIDDLVAALKGGRFEARIFT